MVDALGKLKPFTSGLANWEASMAKNHVIDPHEPHDLKSKAFKMLKELLVRTCISRKNCDEHKISEKNDSIHSIASYIRNKFFVPLLSTRQPPDKRIVHYEIAPEEITRYNDPNQREIQIAEMKTEIDHKRKSKLLKLVKKMVEGEYQKKSPDNQFLNELKKIINLK